MSKPLRKRLLETEEIIKLYQNGESTTVIAKAANVSPRYITMLLKDNNVELRPRGSWKRKYTLNEDYFKTWSNNMAYILGFFIADGTITRQLQSVSISQKEKTILEAIRGELGSNQPLYQNKRTGVYILNLHSQIIKRDLVEIHGVLPNKSSTVAFPYVPSEYMSHFIRGYFDGDGFVKYEKYTVSFVGGSESFMQTLINILKEQGFSPQFQIQGKNYRVHVRGRKSIKQFSDWIYRDVDKELYLTRKYETFKKEKLEVRDLKDRKLLNTKEAVIKRKLNFLAIFAVVQSMESACASIEIQTTTVKRWITKDEAFKNSFELLTES